MAQVCAWSLAPLLCFGLTCYAVPDITYSLIGLQG